MNQHGSLDTRPLIWAFIALVSICGLLTAVLLISSANSRKDKQKWLNSWDGSWVSGSTVPRPGTDEAAFARYTAFDVEGDKVRAFGGQEFFASERLANGKTWNAPQGIKWTEEPVRSFSRHKDYIEFEVDSDASTSIVRITNPSQGIAQLTVTRPTTIHPHGLAIAGASSSGELRKFKIKPVDYIDWMYPED